MKRVVEPKFSDCRRCEHFRGKEACRFLNECNAGEFFEEGVEDCVPTEERLMSEMMRKRRRD